MNPKKDNRLHHSSSLFVFRVFFPSRGLHANMFSFQHFPPQEPVHWVNMNHIPVFFVMQDCICLVFLRPSMTATTLTSTTKFATCLMHPSFRCTCLYHLNLLYLTADLISVMHNFSNREAELTLCFNLTLHIHLIIARSLR